MPNPKTSLLPHQLWRQRFCRAMEKHDEQALDRLLEQHAKDHSLSWASIDPPHPQDPLSLALVREDGWATEKLLVKGFEVTSLMLHDFFARIELFRLAGSRQGSHTIKNVWPALYPAISRSLRLQTHVVSHYFEKQRQGVLAGGVDWETLSMPQVIGDLLEEPVLQTLGMNVTPLQYACLTTNYCLVEKLLRCGASGHKEQPRSDMPRWSLAKALAAAQESIQGAWSTEGIQRYVWEEWGCLAQQPQSEGGGRNPQDQRSQARTWFLNMSNGEFESKRDMLQALLRAQALSEALPCTPALRKGPRF